LSYKPRNYSDGELALLFRLLAEGPLTGADLTTSTVVPGMQPGDTGGYLLSSLKRLLASADVDRQGNEGLYSIAREPSLVLRAAPRRPLAQMRATAETLADALRPLCARIEIAGSIRRQCPTCGDIELCAIVPDGGATEALNLSAALPIRSGQKYTQVIVDIADLGPVTVDFFCTTDPTAWGMLYFIRTGSADFVKRALGYWKKISDGGECRELHLYTGNDTPVPTPEEADVFRALSTPERPVAFIPPERRVPRG